jgi:predicted nucleotidyltransferase
LFWAFQKVVNFMPVHITQIMQDFAENARNILRNSLDSVIVYGSYARGDYSEFSDIDIMLLVSLSDNEIKGIFDQISDLAFEFMLKYGVDISPVITNTDHFNYWVDNLPYYRNIRDEGVKLSA